MLGSKPLEDVTERGHFFCPECKKLRYYNLKVIRRYLTLLFVPVFPIRTLAEFVECQACFGIFENDVLTRKLSATENAYLSHEELLVLWKQLFEETECERIIQGGTWSPYVKTCAVALQKAGAFIFARDYDEARKCLHRIVYATHDLNVTMMEMKAKRIEFNIPEQYIKKQSEIYLAAKEVLQNMP